MHRSVLKPQTYISRTSLILHSPPFDLQQCCCPFISQLCTVSVSLIVDWTDRRVISTGSYPALAKLCAITRPRLARCDKTSNMLASLYVAQLSLPPRRTGQSSATHPWCAHFPYYLTEMCCLCYWGQMCHRQSSLAGRILRSYLPRNRADQCQSRRQVRYTATYQHSRSMR